MYARTEACRSSPVITACEEVQLRAIGVYYIVEVDELGLKVADGAEHIGPCNVTWTLLVFLDILVALTV